jgi:NAD(P)-dependent dehydrogenase (short-subunit alcohol dehydrogenase family)
MQNEALAGRVALVTGGGRGIGRGIAVELARCGAAVVINYRRDEEAAAAVVAEIEAAGGRAAPLQGSLSDLAEVDRLAAESASTFGPVDLLVANAGIASRGLAVTETESSELERVMTTNAIAVHRLAHLLVPAMRERPRGDVVAISSSELAHMRANGAPYNMAKAALEALALTLANEEVGNGIHVNVVAPGLVATDMGSRLVKAKLGVDDISALDAQQPLGRVCRPEDVAAVVRFLCSEDAFYVTGQRVVVDGGADASPTGSSG